MLRTCPDDPGFSQFPNPSHQGLSLRAYYIHPSEVDMLRVYVNVIGGVIV